ncbi:hypothetical protein QBC44DRAFT_377110 [Cladorrhinum sp. PSN332]|nr:hypothetical protein QBC44DRAFT_377110 [Cladorrhinum sp. PSN332]
MDVGNSRLPSPPVGEFKIELPKYKPPGEPDHYRLSAARLGTTKREPSTGWLTRYVSALATPKLEELSTLLQPYYRALHAFGAHHGDPNLSNFQLVNGKIMVLDLESAVFNLSTNDQNLFYEDEH